MAIPEFTSLRKACRNCTKCKRRCVIELPRCRRCRHRGLECTYDLEPLVRGKPVCDRNRRKDGAFRQGTKANFVTSDAFLDFISSLHMSENIQAFYRNQDLGLTNQWPRSTATPVTSDREGTQYIISELLRIPDLVHNGEPSPFINPQLHIVSPCRYLYGRGRGHESSWDITSKLFALDAQMVPLTDLVAAMQALILWLIQEIFNEQSSPRAGPILELMANWRSELWTSAASRMPSNLSRWHSWMLAETVRRTILMSYLLEGTYSAWKDGWCSHQLFVDALLFSMRGALWLATTPEEWCALVSDKRANPDITELVAFHEFTKTFARAPFDPGEDLLQKLLLVAHHGKKPVDTRL